VFKEATILIVDDVESEHEILEQVLGDTYNLKHAFNGKKAIELTSRYKEEIDLILLDYRMPRMDGMETMAKLQELYQLDIPIIFLTSVVGLEAEANCLYNGAVDYVKKPFNPDALKLRIKRHLSYRKKAETAEIDKIESIVHGMSIVTELHSVESSEHAERVQKITEMLVDRLDETTNLFDGCSLRTLDYMCYAAPLHDIGKFGIHNDILHKPGEFTEAEYEEMKKHVVLGCDIANGFYEDKDEGFVKIFNEVIYHHHEKYDGSGYPEGLRGNNIPLAARIVAVADALDAIVSCRSYKDAVDINEALKIMLIERGKSFDPVIVDALLSLRDNIVEFYKKEDEMKLQKLNKYIKKINGS